MTDDVGGCHGRYASASCVWGDQPDEIVATLERHVRLSGAYVLDGGCGEGRHSVHLARRGARVLAVDASEIAVARATRRHGAHGSIEWRVADLHELDIPDASFDGIVLVSVLHWLPDPPSIRQLLSRLQRAVRFGGFHAVVAFNEGEPYRAAPSDTRPPCLMPHDWFVRQYRGWRILAASDTRVRHEHPGHDELHCHAVTSILARRTPR